MYLWVTCLVFLLCSANGQYPDPDDVPDFSWVCNCLMSILRPLYEALSFKPTMKSLFKIIYLKVNNISYNNVGIRKN